MEGTAAVAMATPHLSSPSNMSELQLLQVLRLMSSLRSKSSVETEAQQMTASAAVAVHIRNIDFGSLWDMLMECLDLVRNLEGLTEQDSDGEDEGVGDESLAAAEPAAATSSSSSSTGPSSAKNLGEAAKQQGEDVKRSGKLSSLTMRFMPLIECFLTVCGTTVIQAHSAKPATSVASATPSSDTKRLREQEEQEEDGGDVGAGTLEPTMNGSESPPPGAGLPLTRQLSLPGARFRTHAEFHAMQREVDDANDQVAHRLIKFTAQNRILLNMLLRGNESLLESSFRPLVYEPRCRRLLHFDIKRKYFKMKLRQLRQKAQRAPCGST